MNGYLVLGSTMSDDVPMGMFPTRQAAVEFADAQTESTVVDAVDRLFGRDRSEPSHIAIVKITDGKLSDWEILKEFDA